MVSGSGNSEPSQGDQPAGRGRVEPDWDDSGRQLHCHSGEGPVPRTQGPLPAPGFEHAAVEELL